ncbi:MAG: VCBS repeat-containing protein [Acidobacteria bacterium]|nr:VCBS repeat-containing protein [Acidobacteriota bacterium]
MTRSLLFLVTAVTLGVALAAQTQAPPPSADRRERTWQANNLGVAYLEQFDYAKAAAQFDAALAIDAAFTPARVNLAIARLYEPDLPAALAAATAAAADPTAPPHAAFVLGLIARAENREADAVAAFRRVLAADPDDVASLVHVGQVLVQQREYAEAVPLFTRAVALEPYNVSALYNLAIAQTRAGQREASAATMARFQALREHGYGTTYSNTYLEQGRYAEAIVSTGAEADVLPVAAPPLRYATTSTGVASPVLAMAAGDVDGDGFSEVIVVRDAGLEILRTSAGAAPAPIRATPWPVPSTLGVRGIVIADIDNDGRADLLLHGRAGVTVWRQKGGASTDFEDVTASTTIRTTLDVRTVALADVDHDGDLDLVLGGATRDAGAAAPLALWRNNGDGTFADITTSALPDQGAIVAAAIVPTDVDLRRDIDLVVLGGDGRIRLWRNMRDATFSEVGATFGLDALPAARAIAVADFTKDGFPDIAIATAAGDGVMAVGSARNTFSSRPVATMPRGTVALQAGDVDSDGLLDLVAVTTDGISPLRQHAAGAFEPVAQEVLAGASALVLLDADRSGTLDLLSLRDTTLALHTSSGPSRGFRVTTKGQVSNRSGVGAKVEMRAGSLWQKVETTAASPAVTPADLLFGIGARSAVDVVRVLWPSGVVQAEPITPTLTTAGALTVVELDRKPSSCPYLFTWNGDGFEFITDFLGGGEMGYQASPGVYATPDPEEFVRIRGDQLRARDGRFELRVTNELEETLFLDHLSLIAVDHPEGTDVFPLEGLVSAPQPGLRMATVRNPRPAVHIVDAAGRDASSEAARTDRRYVDGLPLLPIRGYAQPHAVTIDLGAATPAQGAVLLLTGWTDYAFSSDNIAAAQAGHALQPPALQVRDGNGEWTTTIAEIGVPVGRPQTIVVDLSDRFPSASREVRITTSMRVYWDHIAVATRVADARVVTTRLPAAAADLRWRGFSAMVSAQEPLTFDYARVTPDAPWKQMPGRYTREGDVRDLLSAVDDRFVISRPGDEVALAFAADGLPPLPAGLTRTFLLHGDGFSREMDINSANPDSAWPLPSRGPVRASTARVDDPDWMVQHNTRVVSRQVPRLAGVPR